MTTTRCPERGCEKLRFDHPEDLLFHAETDHGEEQLLLAQLGVVWEEPQGVRRGKWDLDPRVLRLLRGQPGTWLRVFTADAGGPKTFATIATPLRNREEYADLEFRAGTVLDSAAMYVRCRAE